MYIRIIARAIRKMSVNDTATLSLKTTFNKLDLLKKQEKHKIRTNYLLTRNSWKPKYC